MSEPRKYIAVSQPFDGFTDDGPTIHLCVHMDDYKDLERQLQWTETEKDCEIIRLKADRDRLLETVEWIAKNEKNYDISYLMAEARATLEALAKGETNG